MSNFPQSLHVQVTVESPISQKQPMIYLEVQDHVPPYTYRLYKRRFLGIIGLVSRNDLHLLISIPHSIQVVLNIVAAMAWPWFGPISNNSLSMNQTPSSLSNTVVIQW